VYVRCTCYVRVWFCSSFTMCAPHLAPPVLPPPLLLVPRRHPDYCVNCALHEVFARSRQFGMGTAVVPGEIVDHLHVVARTLRRGKQEDAHEFLALMLGTSGMHALDACPVMRGQLVGCVRCTVCGTQSTKLDPFETLSLEIGTMDSLEDMLRHFSASEWLDGANKYRCDGKCGNAPVSLHTHTHTPHTHTHTNTRKHTRTRARTGLRTHARAQAHTLTPCTYPPSDPHVYPPPHPAPPPTPAPGANRSPSPSTPPPALPPSPVNAPPRRVDLL
jgi:hypothetical protein